MTSPIVLVALVTLCAIVASVLVGVLGSFIEKNSEPEPDGKAASVRKEQPESKGVER